MIKIDNVTIGYADTDPIRNLSIELPDVGVVEVRGSSGVGKSTLLRAIAGLVPLKHGSIDIGSHQFSYVFQENRLITSLSALQNVLFVQPNRDIALAALKDVALESVANKSVQQFSGGMQRRVAIARAICKKCDALILDEPFDGLDSDLKITIAKAIVDHFSLIIIATHGDDVKYFLNKPTTTVQIALL